MIKKTIDLGRVVGDSAYELAVKNGFKGTLPEYLASLVGKNGRDGIDGKTGERGEQGEQGVQGKQGIQGERGQSIDFKGALKSPDDLPKDHIEDGDAYLIDTQLYVWLEETGEWIKSGSIQGPQGIQGIQGVDGIQGIPGVKGEDGKTQYLHIAYANSIDGGTDFSTSDSNRTYIGLYADFKVDDSLTPGDYAWTLVKGADGKPGKDGKPSYLHVAWANNADGIDGFTTVYPNLNLLNDTSPILKTLTTSGWGYNYVDSKRHNLDFKKGQTITYSVWIQDCDINARGVVYLYDSQNKQYNNFGNIIKAGTSGFSTVTVSIDIDVTRVIASVGFLAKQSDSHSFSYSKLKLELGSVATTWMPSSDEVKTSDYPKYMGTYTDDKADGSTKPTDYTWSLMRGDDGNTGASNLPMLRGQIVTTSLITEKNSINPGEPVPEYPYAMVSIELTIPEAVYKPGAYKLIGFGTGNDDGETLAYGFSTYDRDTGKYVDITQDKPWPLRPMDFHASFNPMSYKGTALTTAVTIMQAQAMNLAMINTHSMGTLDSLNPSALVQYPDGTIHMFKLDSVFKPSIADQHRIGMIKPSEGSFYVDSDSGRLQFDPSVMPIKLSVIHNTKDDSYFIHMTDAMFTSFLPDDMPRPKEDVSVFIKINMINQNSEFVSSSDDGLTFIGVSKPDSAHMTLHPYKEKYRGGEFEKVDGLHIDASTMVKSIEVILPGRIWKDEETTMFEFKNVSVSYREIIK